MHIGRFVAPKSGQLYTHLKLPQSQLLVLEMALHYYIGSLLHG